MADDANNIDEVLSDPVLAELMGELRAVAEEPPPQITPELESIFRQSDQLAHAREKRRNRLRSGGIGLAVAGVVAAGLGAAAANELPTPAQRAVARVVNGLTPFEIPSPAAEGTSNDPVDPANSVVRPDQDGGEVRDRDAESSSTDNDDDDPGLAESADEEVRDRGDDDHESSEDSDDGDESGDGGEDGDGSSGDSDDGDFDGDGGDGGQDGDTDGDGGDDGDGEGESEDSESSSDDDDSESGDDEED